MKSGIARILLSLSVSVAAVACAQNNQNEKTQTHTENSGAQLLSNTQFQQKLNDLPDEQIIDVRTPEEFSTGYISGAININIYDSDFDQQIEKLDKSRPVMVYCKAGGRSADAAEKFESAGFSSVFDLQGGIMSWTNKSLPVETTKPPAADKFTADDYKKIIASPEPVLIDYYAPWCGPCRKMEPVLEKLKSEFAGKVNIVRINVDEATLLAKELNIENIPVITAHKNGKEIAKTSGYQSEEQLRAMISGLLK
jgi:thioredoxin